MPSHTSAHRIPFHEVPHASFGESTVRRFPVSAVRTPNDESRSFPALTATVVAVLMRERPTWLPTFEEVAEFYARDERPAPPAIATFLTGMIRCRQIMASTGMSAPPIKVVFMVAVFAGRAMARARALTNLSEVST